MDAGGEPMIRKYRKTNLFIIDDNLWNWAQYRARQLGYRSASEYVFYLVKLDREGKIRETLAKIGAGKEKET